MTKEAIYLIAVLLGPGDIQFEARSIDQFGNKQECNQYIQDNGDSVVRGIANQYHFEQSIDETKGKFSLPLQKIFLVCTPISIDNL
tara:strand:+ start:235 stop:492 length:258 start_codon:yes stop_codon:yes gene_type:complete